LQGNHLPLKVARIRQLLLQGFFCIGDLHCGSVFSPSSVEHCSNTARDDVARSFLAFAARSTGNPRDDVVRSAFVIARTPPVQRVASACSSHVSSGINFVLMTGKRSARSNTPLVSIKRGHGVKGIVLTASVHTTSLVDKRRSPSGPFFVRWNQWGHRTIPRVADV
jgi:hypothetical protein